MVANRLQQTLIPTSAIGLWLLLAACTSGPSNTVSATVQVTVQRTDDLREVSDSAREFAAEHGRSNVLVAFDLDNTLLAMRTALGSDQWYDWQRELQQQDRCDSRLVTDRLAAQGALFHVGAMRPTQADAAAIVDELQSDGFTTIIVTARGQDFRLPTFRELRRNQLSFRDHALGPVGGFAENYTPANAKRPVRFEDGVYMLAGQHKGDLLLALYEQLKAPLPAAVVFVDDKAKNVQAMSEAMIGAGIPAKLFIYQREATNDFPAAQVTAQWLRLEPALQVVEDVMGTLNFDLPTAFETDQCMQ